jgi:putative AdoMet-dependent methyltransferase
MSCAPSGWTYNEFAQLGIDFADPAEVEAYDRRQGDKDAVNAQLLQGLGVGKGHVVADLGAGTGSLAIQAALAGATVHAVDISPAMLERARAKAGQAGAAGISFHHAGFLTYEPTPATADFVFSQFALHHLPDFWKQAAILRVAKSLRRGGLFYLKDVVFSFEPDRQEEGVKGWLSAVSHEDGKGWSRADLESHVRDEYSTFAWIIEGMLARAGFDIERADYSLSAYASYLARKR